MEIKIMKSFNLFGHKFTVKETDDLVQRDGAVGIYRHAKQEVTIQKSIKGNELTTTRREQTLYHELVHVILGEIGEDDLYQNEKFVDLFAQGLHQVFSSAKY